MTGRHKALLAERCEVKPDTLPKYLVFIRWDAFRLDLVGRVQIIAAITLAAALIGLRVFAF